MNYQSLYGCHVKDLIMSRKNRQSHYIVTITSELLFNSSRVPSLE